MALPDIFTKEVSDEMVKRINKLKPDSQPVWGKMNASQMLAHLNVAYEMVYDNIHPEPNALLKLILKVLVKKKVVGETPFSHNGRTGQQFIIKDVRNFETEKNRLIDYIYKTQQSGEKFFDNRESHSFGRLTKDEWNNSFYKHLDHHLSQFGV